MKKYLISSFAAFAFLFGFASCSGDLHDIPAFKPEPVVIEGAQWYYADITVWGDVPNDDTAGLIVNNNNQGIQTSDTNLPVFAAADGGVFCYTYDGSNVGTMNVSYQEDNPSDAPTAGKIRIYVYTSCSTPCLHYWGGPFKATSWPGVLMTKAGEVAKDTYDTSMTITTVEVTGLTGLTTDVWMTGAFAEWPNPGEENSIKCSVNDDSIKLENVSIKFKAEGVNVGEVGTSEFKFASSGWARPEIVNESGNNLSVRIDPSCTKLKIICTSVLDKQYKCVVVQE